MFHQASVTTSNMHILKEMSLCSSPLPIPQAVAHYVTNILLHNKCSSESATPVDEFKFSTLVLCSRAAIHKFLMDI